MMTDHELASIFPMMTGTAFTELKADIARNGVREPIVLHEGKILDGRNRALACDELGIDCPSREFDGPDALQFVVSMNLHRRHLDESQRAMVAARLATLREGANQHAPIGAPSQGAAAELLNVGRRSVQRARKVIDSGSPSMIAAVDQGDISVSAAAKELMATAISTAQETIDEDAEAPRQRAEFECTDGYGVEMWRAALWHARQFEEAVLDADPHRCPEELLLELRLLIDDLGGLLEEHDERDTKADVT